MYYHIERYVSLLSQSDFQKMLLIACQLFGGRELETAGVKLKGGHLKLERPWIPDLASLAQE